MAIETPEPETLTRRPPWSAGPLAAIAVVAAGLTLWQFQAPPQQPPFTSAAATGKTVTLALEREGAEQAFPPIPWQEGLTVQQAMELARARGGPAFVQQGEGAAAFVTEIDGLKNGDGGAEAKHWLYFIDGEGGQKSFALQTVEPGARILWKFTKFE